MPAWSLRTQVTTISKCEKQTWDEEREVYRIHA
jgi:hypothetical protein